MLVIWLFTILAYVDGDLNFELFKYITFSFLFFLTLQFVLLGFRAIGLISYLILFSVCCLILTL